MVTRARARRCAAVVLVLAVGGCGVPQAGALPAPPPAAPAGSPSPQARMVCEEEARDDIGALLGVPATQVGPLQVTGSTTTCRYAYPDGSFLLAVQDLPDVTASAAAYDALAARLGRVRDIPLPGGAVGFGVAAGSVIVRKDTKVMLVDVTGLPDRFGRPPVPRADAALLVTKAVLSCWTG